MNQYVPPANTEARHRIAFVQASWHRDIVGRGREAFNDAMRYHGWDGDIDVVDVPGSLEIPFVARRLAASGSYIAIVGAGFVVDGGIYRHEFVAGAVIEGLMKVQLETDVPILSMVLTPQHFHEHEEHARFFREHFAVKGKEVAAACVRMVALLRELNTSQVSRPIKPSRERETATKPQLPTAPAADLRSIPSDAS